MYVDDATLEQIEMVLQEMIVGDVKTALVIGLYGPMDGVLLSAGMPHVSNESDLGDSFAEIVQIAQEMSLELGRGMMQQMVINNKDGPIFISPILDIACLAVIGHANPLFGLIIYEMKAATERIIGLLPE